MIGEADCCAHLHGATTMLATWKRLRTRIARIAVPEFITSFKPGSHLLNMNKHENKHKRGKIPVWTCMKYAQAQAQEKETFSFSCARPYLACLASATSINNSVVVIGPLCACVFSVFIFFPLPLFVCGNRFSTRCILIICNLNFPFVKPL